MADPAYDGHQALIGVFGGSPDTVPAFYAHQAVNRFFRHDENKARPSIRNIEITFESEADRIWFEGGNGQGAYFYNSYPSTQSPNLITSVAGKIFAIEMRGGRNAHATVIAEGNAATFTHAWFGQGFEWLAINDGIHAPIFWDGVNPSRRSDLTKNEMPVGSLIAFIHGRFVIASADGKNTIRVGEIAYANTNTNRNDILVFPTEIPSFDTATFLGDIMGLQPMPFLDTGDAQNELVVLCQNGFTSFDFSGPEETFLGPIQKISLVGEGCVSSHGFDTLNGDVFYRRADGIGSYRNARVEYSQAWSQTPISRPVDHWLRFDRSDLLQYEPLIGWQNMVFCGCSPMVSPPNNPCAGYHRYCRGFVVFDAQSMSNSSRDGVPVWHGMWTGIRPWAFIAGRISTADRCFAFSYDRDGKNRLYELTLQDGDDFFEDTPRKIASRYETATMGSVEGRTSYFGLKRMTGGVIELNSIRNACSFTVSYRPDGAPCWVPIDSGTPGCDCPTRDPCIINSQPAFARKYFESIEDAACVKGTNQPANTFHHCQLRVEMEGSMKVERMNLRFEIEQASQVAACMGKDCRQIDCCPDANDYTYHIAPTGTNTEIPNIGCPEQPIPSFTSTRFFTAWCPDRSNSVTAQGQAISGVSQADADALALQAAAANAQAQLVCFECDPETIIEFTINGGVADLSSFFAEGQFNSNIDQPWRLYDIIIQQYIAAGTVDITGTLDTVTVYPDYTHGSFDASTNVYTDLGGGSTTIALELGCPNGPTFPPHPPY